MIRVCDGKSTRDYNYLQKVIVPSINSLCIKDLLSARLYS